MIEKFFLHDNFLTNKFNVKKIIMILFVIENFVRFKKQFLRFVIIVKFNDSVNDNLIFNKTIKQIELSINKIQQLLINDFIKKFANSI